MMSEKLNSGEKYDIAKKVIEKELPKVEKYTIYELNLNDADGVELHQLGGKVKVTLPLPFKLGKDRMVEVYRVEGEKLIKCSSSVSGEYLTFETDHFSTYVFAEAMMDSSSVGMMIVLYIVVAIVLLVAFGCIIFFHKNQKRNIAGSRG